MSYLQYVVVRNALRKSVAELGDVLQSFPKGEMGLTPDEVKKSSEYRTAKAAYDHAFHCLRGVNAKGTKLYKKELAETRKAEMAEKMKKVAENDAC